MGCSAAGGSFADKCLFVMMCVHVCLLRKNAYLRSPSHVCVCQGIQNVNPCRNAYCVSTYSARVELDAYAYIAFACEFGFARKSYGNASHCKSSLLLYMLCPGVQACAVFGCECSEFWDTSCITESSNHGCNRELHLECTALKHCCPQSSN